jgi:selenide,water dikinase
MEKPGDSAGAVRLTRLVKNAGCASKIPPGELARVLSQLPPVTDPRLLVGSATADDAGVFQVSPDLCLVQTVDVFTPCVDDPYTFGRIAAANSLSDVYAMGGRPLTALSIIGYPVSSLPEEWMGEILRGGMETLAEAGVVLVGGHSINDDEIKFGFAVTGLIGANAIITNAAAQPGDALILTKPLGTGIVAFAAQVERACQEALQASAASMTALNRPASEVMVEMGAHACTDITGFGLLAHLAHIVRESAVSAEVWWDAVPFLPHALDYAREGLVSGAAEHNREFCAEIVRLAPGAPEHIVDALYDPQTSGGLLFAVPVEVADDTLVKLRAAGCADAAIVGRIADRPERSIFVTRKSRSTDRPSDQPAEQPCCAASQATQQQPCCASVGGPQEPLAPTAAAGAEPCCPEAAASAGAPNAQRAFQQFMAAAFAPGALDPVQKALTAIALSVAVQCAPCLRTHVQKALNMGLAAEEITEAAWMGIAFGGCKAMMFWNEHSALLGTNQGSGVSK